MLVLYSLNTCQLQCFCTINTCDHLLYCHLYTSHLHLCNRGWIFPHTYRYTMYEGICLLLHIRILNPMDFKGNHLCILLIVCIFNQRAECSVIEDRSSESILK